MATITFTATDPKTGETYTRTSGTMPYVAVSVGSQVQWHKTFAAAHKAAVSKVQTWQTGKPADVIPAVPTAINGKIDADDFAEGWGDIPAEAFAELVAEKLAKPAKGKKAPKLVELTDEQVDEALAQIEAEAEPTKADLEGVTITATLDPTPEFVGTITAEGTTIEPVSVEDAFADVVDAIQAEAEPVTEKPARVRKTDEEKKAARRARRAARRAAETTEQAEARKAARRARRAARKAKKEAETSAA